MPVTPARLHTYRALMSLAIAASHAALAILGILGRLTYAIPSRYVLLRDVLTNDLWIWLHAAAALAIVITILTHRREVNALGASVGIWSVWSFLSLLWGLSTDPPVALVGPVLAGMITTLAYILTLSWATDVRAATPTSEAGE